MLNLVDVMSRHLTDAIGSYPDRDEFQVGRVIVSVTTPADDSRAAWLARANELFEHVWEAVPDVLAFARRHSQPASNADGPADRAADVTSETLAVRGIWIHPGTGTADYDVERHPDPACA